MFEISTVTHIASQGWFQVNAQAMRDVVTKELRLSLAGCKPRISPAINITNCVNRDSIFS